jgi:hypothetical protein
MIGITMYFSYLSRIPSSALQIERRFKDYLSDDLLMLTGCFNGKTRDVFQDYYKARREGREAPHYEFANTPASTEGIIGFTQKWGPLFHDTPANPHPCFTPEWKAFRPIKDIFEMRVDHWLECHDGFRAMLQLCKRQRSDEDREKLTRSFQTRVGPLLRDFEPISPSIEFERRRLKIVLKVSRLHEALWLMAWEDLSIAGARIAQCKDPNCRKFFDTDDWRRKFCPTRPCAQRYYKRLWARKNLRRLRSEKKAR